MVFWISQALTAVVALGQIADPGLAIRDLPTLNPGRTAAQNALWIENPLSARFNSSKRVVVAEIEGPATITMMHFAMPQVLKLNRDLLLRAYWDGEAAPSVDCPLVDFFCDPAGLRDAPECVRDAVKDEPDVTACHGPT